MKNMMWLADKCLADTLAQFRIGCDKRNYEILQKCPTTILELQKILETKGVKPINSRVNALEEVGLVIRERGAGKVRITQEGKNLVSLVKRRYAKLIEERLD